MAEPLGFEELFDDGRSATDSWCDYLAATRLLASEADVVVEAGCGRGLEAIVAGDAGASNDLRGAGRTVIGIDVDPAGTDNPAIDEFRLIGDDGRWPLDDAAVDLVVSDWVLEHVEDAEGFVAELARVLRPGGAFVARTVSRRSPLSIGARLIPNRLHARVVGRMQPGRVAQDVFPTAYNMNTRGDLRRLLDDRFTWRATARTGLEQYALRWPWVARTLRAVEPRLPAASQMVLVVYARRR